MLGDSWNRIAAAIGKSFVVWLGRSALSVSLKLKVFGIWGWNVAVHRYKTERSLVRYEVGFLKACTMNLVTRKLDT